MTQEAHILADVIEPALAMLPPKMSNRLARVSMVSIGLQESRLIARVQSGGGPAHGLWQFERGGGVRGVLNHFATGQLARDICGRLDVDDTPNGVWAELPHNDILAAAFARLLLYSDPQPLPSDEEGCWQLYLRTWRPGAFKRDPIGLRRKWAANFRRALAAVQLESPA